MSGTYLSILQMNDSHGYMISTRSYSGMENMLSMN